MFINTYSKTSLYDSYHNVIRRNKIKYNITRDNAQTEIWRENKISRQGRSCVTKYML